MQSYSFSLQASFGMAPFTYQLVSGSLPPGLRMDQHGNITGTPTGVGQFPFEVQATDSSQPPQQQTYNYTLSVVIGVDTYGGLTAAPISGCTPTGYFQLQKANSRWLLADPNCKAFWGYSVQNATYTFIESGVMQARYGNNYTPWFTRNLERMQDWGFNTVGDYASVGFFPVGNVVNGSGASVKMPFILLFRAMAEAEYDPSFCGAYTLPIKDITAGVPSAYGIYDGESVPDTYDPMWPACVNAEISSLRSQFTSGDFNNIPWIVGITTEDADTFVWAWKGTGNNPIKPNVYPHIGFEIAVANPDYKSLGYAADPELHAKYAWSQYLQTKYTTIAALNSAWTSSYTTFGTSGGYGVGTGVLDENGSVPGSCLTRCVPTPWLGSDPFNLTGARAAVVTDLNAFLYNYVYQGESTEVTALRAYDNHHLLFGPNALGGEGDYGTRPQVLAALAAAGVDAFFFRYDSLYPFNISTPVNAYDTTGKPSLMWYGLSANQDSYWSPQPSGNDADYPTQVKRGQVYAADQQNIFSAQASDSSFPIVGVDFWGLTDDTPEEHTNWGLISNKDNAYDGKCAVIAQSVDQWGFPCGGEKANYGDFLDAVTQSNSNIFQQFILQQLQ
jgi:hypothetical protein